MVDYSNFKVLILAGGFGSRLDDLTKSIPKPMVKIGKDPIIIDIMKIYLRFNINNFFIALGYKGNQLVKYFLKKKINPKTKSTFSKLKIEKKISIKCRVDNKICNVTLIPTGLNTMTGGRLKRAANFIKDKDFLFTYGDGLSNVNLKKLIRFHFKHKRLITVTAVNPPPRFGQIELNDYVVKKFSEKNYISNVWINGGFFMVNQSFMKLIKNDKTILEREPLEKASKKRQLIAFKHKGFWQCMDTKRDRDKLIILAKKRIRPWLS
jgi:glucose-1-phosphate cytidylyltransferase